MSLRCGLIVNPVAGLGGEVALAGSDGVATQRLARERGATARSGERMLRALRSVLAQSADVEFLCGDGPMGADVCAAAGVHHRVAAASDSPTSAADTVALARAIRDAGAELLLFAGGDGTARDVCAAIGRSVPVLGIPAGVKMHSAVFTVTPEDAGPLVAAFAAGRTRAEDAEVVDLDEAARRAGRLGSRLYGVLSVPRMKGAVQRGKTATPPGGDGAVSEIAAEVASRLAPGVPCLLGPGSTVAAVAARLGVESSLLGFDALEDGELVGRDLAASQLREIVAGRRFQVVLSPVGGNGIVLGRGNQQLDAGLLSELAPEDLMLVCPPRKLAQFAGRGLLVDAPSAALNDRFRGARRVITGFRQEAVVHVG